MYEDSVIFLSIFQQYFFEMIIKNMYIDEKDNKFNLISKYFNLTFYSKRIILRHK